MRIRIFALMALLAALPTIFELIEPQVPRVASTQARAISTISAAVPAPKSASDNWFDVFKTLVGTFTGAGLAFLANLEIQKRTRRREEKAAGNYAMAVLARQYNGFLNLKRTVEEEAQRCRDRAPLAPVWFVFRPVMHFLRDDLEFDFQSLTFLFEDARNIETFQILHSVETLQRELIGFMKTFTDASVAKQDKLGALGFVIDGSAANIEGGIQMLGQKLAMSLQNTLEEIFRHCSVDEATYLAGSQSLHRALGDRFGTVGLIRVSAPARAETTVALAQQPPQTAG